MAQAIRSSGHSSHLKDESRRTVSQIRFLGTALAAVSAITLFAALAAVLVPAVRPLLLQEDGIVETASAVVLLLVVPGAVYAIYRWGPRFPFVIAGLLGFAELMDETSFGSRIFGFDPPPLYGGGQLDGFHDLLILVFRLVHNFSLNLAWLWVALLLAGSAALVAFALFQLWKDVGLKMADPSSHILLVLHVGLIGLAQVIDLATHSRILSAVEEVFELDAQILLGFYLVQHAYLATGPDRATPASP